MRRWGIVLVIVGVALLAGGHGNVGRDSVGHDDVGAAIPAVMVEAGDRGVSIDATTTPGGSCDHDAAAASADARPSYCPTDGTPQGTEGDRP